MPRTVQIVEFANEGTNSGCTNIYITTQMLHEHHSHSELTFFIVSIDTDPLHSLLGNILTGEGACAGFTPEDTLVSKLRHAVFIPQVPEVLL